MKKKSWKYCKSFSLLLALLMIASTFLIFPLTTSAATITKTEKSYDIAVVFDNSGSMYQNQGWCRAKYAMEIFASMLNYEKDRLHIFPMWEVTTDGSQPNSGGSYSMIEIKDKKDIDKISNLYTVNPSNTPFAPITEANNYLHTSHADEKWLIILTDGAFNQEARGQSSAIDLQKRASSLASKEIKVQYLGFGGAIALKSNEANNFFAKKSSDTSLKDDLIEICNSIFQRSVLPGNCLSGEKLNLNLSMKNVIVFAQGANAKITSMKDSNEKEVTVSLDSGQRKYSNIKAKGYVNAPIDTSLAGQVVTFTSCPKGEYTLSCSGADKIQVFYEPDVAIDISFTNSDGQKIKNPDEFVAGEYTVNSRIVDAKTNEDVTSHELMGNNVKLNTYVKVSKDSERKEYKNGSKITFEPNNSTEIWVEGEYLGKYKISSKDDPKWKWLDNIEIKSKTVDFKIEATVLQSQSWFNIKDHDNWKPIRVVMTLDGQPLTDEQLAKTKMSVTSSGTGKLEYRCEPVQGESSYNIYIAQDESAKYVEPNTGNYELSITTTYKDEYEKNILSNKTKVSFEIHRYNKLIQDLIFFGVFLLVLLFLAIITMILHKIVALPKITIENSKYRVNGSVAGGVRAVLTVTNNGLFKKTGIITISSTQGAFGTSLTIEAAHNLFKFPFRYQSSNIRSYRITGIKLGDASSITVSAVTYDKHNINEFVPIFVTSRTSVEVEKNVQGTKKHLETDIVNL